MSANNRFSFAIHIMTILAYVDGEGATSHRLAESVGTNPVVVRRLLSQLHHANLIHCKPGKSGGCKLNRDPERISLHDVYLAVEAGEPFAIPHKPVEKNCAVSCQMQTILSDVFDETKVAIANRLKKITIGDLLKTVQAAV